MMSSRSSEIEDTENKRDQISESAKLILEANRVGNKEMVEGVLQRQISTMLLGDHDKYIQTT